MNLRSKLLLYFVLVFLLFSGIAGYALSLYQKGVNQELNLFESTRQRIDRAYAVQASLNEQLTAWKNLLLRGYQGEHFHRYLSHFYRAERDTRAAIGELAAVVDDARARQQVAQLADAHVDMGRSLRDAIQVYNASGFNAGEIADRFSAGMEELPRTLLSGILNNLESHRQQRLQALSQSRGEQLRLAFILLLVLLVPAVAILIWLLDKNIARPAAEAAELAAVLEHAQQMANFGNWVWDSQGDSHTWSSGLRRILDVGDEEQAGVSAFLARVVSADRGACREALAQAAQSNTPFRLQPRVRLSSGEERGLLMRGECLQNESDSGRFNILVHDITDRMRSEQRLSNLANFDQLTGLPNRHLFEDRLDHAIARARRDNDRVALLFIDLDHFKSVNDALGHHTGDQLLMEVAGRIRDTIRESDTAARLGGDEFTIVVEHFEDNAQVATIAQNLLQRLNAGYRLQQQEVFVSASIGIACYPTDGADVETLLKNSDASMYMAKGQGRNGYHFFTEELNQRAQQRLQLENNLRKAVDAGAFELHFQPQIELVSGRVTGAEALLRWRHEGENISPADFVPVLEDTGLILPVGVWVLEQACAQARRWRDLGYGEFAIAVNVAAQQLRVTDFVARVDAELERHGLSPQHLELELTETSLVDSSLSGSSFSALERLGVNLAIDDFGTGYSSLAYLQQYAVDVIKVDRAFIKDIGIDRQDDAITRAVVALSHSLGLDVVAEGVETLEQLQFLQGLHCDKAQGFLVARPMPAADFERWMAACHCPDSASYRWVAPSA